jgi:hypothetical protein
MPYDDRDAEVDAEIAKLHSAVGSAKCANCGSEHVVPNVTIHGEHTLKLVVMADPQALLFKGWESTELTARVCGDCGYTQLFAKNPKLIYSVYQQSLKNAPRKQSEVG